MVPLSEPPNTFTLASGAYTVPETESEPPATLTTSNGPKVSDGAT